MAKPTVSRPTPRAITALGDRRVSSIISPAQVRIPEVFVGLDHRFFDTHALWDTGATNTVIDARLAAKMQLPVTGQTRVRGVHGEAEVNTYIIDILLPSKVGFREWRVTEGQITDPCGLLIGMDIITMGDFALTRKAGRSMFSFRIPPAEQQIDFVERLNAQRAKEAKRQSKQKFWKPPQNFKKRSSKR